VPDRPDAVTARLGRRTFLRGLGGLAGAVALGPLGSPAAAPAGAAGRVSEQDWADLRRRLEGDILAAGLLRRESSPALRRQGEGRSRLRLPLPPGDPARQRGRRIEA